MTIILTNDDGIDAPGLAALREAVAQLPGRHEVLVVAPAGPMSECSHRVTTKHPLHVESRGPRQWAVEGTPADCTRVALLHLLPELGIELDPARIRVISGINSGGNLGADIYISGTVAAVREAAFFEIPGIAMSQYRRGQPESVDWARSTRWAAGVLNALLEQPVEPGVFWNVNFPWHGQAEENPRVIYCERSRQPLPVKYRHLEGRLHYVGEHYHQRKREPGSDVDICFGGEIAVSRIRL